jgi:hypothetical protein
MSNRQGWKFVARDALALYVLSYLIRFPARAILSLLPLIHYSIVASLGGYLGLKFKNRHNDKRAAS